MHIKIAILYEVSSIFDFSNPEVQDVQALTIIVVLQKHYRVDRYIDW